MEAQIREVAETGESLRRKTFDVRHLSNNPTSMTLRYARPDDWPFMVEVFRAAGKDAWPHILPESFLANLSPPERWREAMADWQQIVLIAEVDGRVVAYAVLRRSGDADSNGTTGELDSFYAHPEVWGQGAGKALLERVLVEGRTIGFKELTLWTAELNHRPRKIYSRAGWALDGARRERTLGGQAFVELRYRIALNPPASE